MKIETLLDVFQEYSKHVEDELSPFKAIHHVEMVAGHCRNRKEAWKALCEQDENPELIKTCPF